MNHVFAKIKGHGKKLIFKLISDSALFDAVEIDPNFCVEYNPDYNLSMYRRLAEIAGEYLKKRQLGLCRRPFANP